MNTTGICRECGVNKAPTGHRTCGASECQEAATYFCKVLVRRPGTKKHAVAKDAYQAKKMLAVQFANARDPKSPIEMTAG